MPCRPVGSQMTDNCAVHTDVSSCTGNQADGTPRKVAGTPTSDASCAPCTAGTAAADGATDCASTATTAAATTAAPKSPSANTQLSAEEDAAVMHTLGAAAAFAVALSIAGLF